MNIFGIGIGELVFILLIALIILGPDGMVKTAASAGKAIRKLIHSPIWATLMSTQKELRDVPTRIVREAGLDEDLKELRKTGQEIRNFTLDDAALDKLTAQKESKPVASASSPRPETPEITSAEPRSENVAESQPADSANTITPADTAEEKTE
ncbi:MAG: twin-arginine translocase TatA/TatE family subunit [Anaerolineaceae bacterium]